MKLKICKSRLRKLLVQKQKYLRDFTNVNKENPRDSYSISYNLSCSNQIPIARIYHPTSYHSCPKIIQVNMR